MRNRWNWNLVLTLIVEGFFVLIGIQVLLEGNYMFAIIWLLLTGTTLYRTIQATFFNQSSIYYTETNEDVNVYGHRTRSSYEKERLYKLEELYNSRLISKDEYDTKRKEIIDQL